MHSQKLFTITVRILSRGVLFRAFLYLKSLNTINKIKRKIDAQISVFQLQAKFQGKRPTHVLYIYSARKIYLRHV